MFVTLDQDTGKGIVISRPIHFPPSQDKDGKVTFKEFSKMLYLNPDTVNNNRDSLLLVIKPTHLFHRGAIYKFETSNIRGFQFDGKDKKINEYTVVEIFDKNDNQYEFSFRGFSQREIDYTLSSISFKQ